MGLVAGPVAQPIVRPVVGGWRTLSRRFADILKGRTAIAYDPQDLATMYQDPQGTLPVYRPGSGAVDPPVGLLLDKSMGLELGPELVVNGTFDYDLTGCSVVGSSSTKQIALESQSIRVSASTTGTCVALFGLSTPLVIGRWYMIKITCLAQASGTSLNEVYMGAGGKVVGSFPSPGVKTFFASAPSAYASVGVGRVSNGKNELTFSQWDNVSVREIKGYHAYQTTTTARPKLSGRYNLLTATETLSTQSVTTAAADYTLRFEGTGSITLSGAATGVLSAGTHTVTCTAGTLTLTVAGSVTKADLRVKRDGSSLPPYQRVDSATTYDTTGFPLYLKRDRVDDNLIVQAPAITGLRAWGSIDTVDIAAATITAGAYQPFGTINAGEPTCTQWIAIDGALTAAEQAVLERYVYSKSKLPVGA